MKRMLISLGLVLFIWAFDAGHALEGVWLRIRMATLQSELDKSSKTFRTMEEIGIAMDSIDRSRDDLAVLLDENKSHRKYGSRLAEINDYVIVSRKRIEILNEKINLLSNDAPEYAEIILGLKIKLERKNRELENLKEAIHKFQEENNNLFRNASLQEERIANHQEQLEAKNEELKTLQIKIQAALEQKQIMESEARCGEARAVEEVANRTHFAPEKKEQALREALALYEQSLALGNEECRDKVAELRLLLLKR